MAPQTDQEVIAAGQEQARLRKTIVNENLRAHFDNIHEYEKEHLAIHRLFQKPAGKDGKAGDIIFITAMDLERRLPVKEVGNKGVMPNPPDYPFAPEKVGRFKSIYVMDEESYRYDSKQSVHYCDFVYTPKGGEWVLFVVREGGYKHLNPKEQKLSLDKFLDLIKGSRVIGNE